MTEHGGQEVSELRPRGAAVVAAVLATLLAACGDEAGECQSDMQCGMTQACVHRMCVGRLGPGESAVWSIEVVPAAGSPHGARELPDFTFTSTLATVAVDRQLMLAATIIRPLGPVSATATSMNVTASVPSTIAGRRNLTFEGQAVNGGGTSPYELNLTVPERLVGQTARLTVSPTAPLNRTVCPWWLDFPLVAMSAVTLPGPEDTLALRGTMEATEAGATTSLKYEARVFVGDALASNLALTNTMGRFDVEVQRSWALRPSVTARLEIAVSDPALHMPVLTRPLPTAEEDLGVLRMPTHPAPVDLVVPVVDQMTMKAVAGATVRLSTVIPGAVGGEARFMRSAQTGADGRATIPVVPSAEGQALVYAVKVVPPSDSESSPRCQAAYGVVAPGADGTRLGPAIGLSRRAVLDGRVVRPGGRAAAGLRVRATRTGDAFDEACGGALVSPPAETVTDGDGRYRLRLDPGQYRLDYQPEGISALPWATEDSVPVLISMGREVALPATVMVEGQVVDGAGNGVGGATLRAFGPGPDGVAEIRGTAVTDGRGRFRLVLPKQVPASPAP